MEGKLAALLASTGRWRRCAAEQGPQVFQAPVGQGASRRRLRRFEALEPFKAIEERRKAFSAKPSYQIFVRNGGTTQNKTVTIKVAHDTTVDELKGTLVERTGVPPPGALVSG